MSELEMPTVITAIANPEVEGFVAGTLFAQGWNVVFRAIDWISLQNYLQSNTEITQNALLIFGTDLPVGPTGVRSPFKFLECDAQGGENTFEEADTAIAFILGQLPFYSVKVFVS